MDMEKGASSPFAEDGEIAGVVEKRRDARFSLLEERLHVAVEEVLGDAT